MNFSFEMKDLFLISPLLCLFFFSLIPITAKVLNGNKEPKGIFSVLLPILGLLISSGLGVGALFYNIIQGEYHRSLIFSKSLWVDSPGLFSLFVLCFLGVATILLAKNSVSITKKTIFRMGFLVFKLYFRCSFSVLV